VVTTVCGRSPRSGGPGRRARGGGPGAAGPVDDRIRPLHDRRVGNRIEPAATSRSRCVTCGQPIEKGAARLAEEYSDISLRKLIFRYYHVKCAAAVHPEMVRRALDDVRPGAVFNRAEIEAKIGPRVAHADEQRRRNYEARLAGKAAAAPVVAADETTLDLLAQLDADPEDPGTLAVVADQLQARGDVRGELIAIQLALAAAGRVAIRRLPARGAGGDDDEDDDDDPAAGLDLDGLTRRRGELLAQLSAPIEGGDRAEWGVGFLRRLELRRRSAERLQEQIALWSHPSVRFLQELRVAFDSPRDAAWLARLAEVAPRGVRRLEVEVEVEVDQPLVELPALLAALPRLESLALDARADYERLAHPGLARLSIGKARRMGEPAQIAARLAPPSLPALVALSLAASSEYVYDPADDGAGPFSFLRTMPRQHRDDLDEVCALLAVRWLARLTRLSLTGGTLTEAGVAALARGLAGRKLQRLELVDTEVPLSAHAPLARLCDELVFPMPAVTADQAVWVEHANKPEWGRGEIVRRFEGKLEVKFPSHGVKVFKADAPFLRLGS